MLSPHRAVALSLPARALTQSLDGVSVSALGSPYATPVSCRTAARSHKSHATGTPVSMAHTPAGSPSSRSPMGAVARQAEFHLSRSGPATVRTTVVAPGAGTGINAVVYEHLQDSAEFKLSIVGQSRGPYDVYPASWSHGAPPPNLETFATGEVLRWVDNTDCFIFGSRGGQVVLPTLWRERGSSVPPAVVINGGCAMNLPEPCQWPGSAVTFMLIGGQDNFRGSLSEEAYVAETKRHVPASNGSTAILYVSEMTHMPQAQLLNAILPHMLRTALAWKVVQQTGQGRRRVKEEMRLILGALNKDGWSGHLMYTESEGRWEDVAFGPYIVDRQPMSRFAIPAEECCAGSAHEYTRKEELLDMFRAAAANARPSGGVPAAQHGARFGAAVHAAVLAAQAAQRPRPAVASQLQLPIPATRSLQLPLPLPRSGHSPHSAYSGSSSMVEATPISRALGLRRGRHEASPGGSYTNSPSYCMVVPPVY